MNHDAAHCYEHTDQCPETCYRARLTSELKELRRKGAYQLPTSWVHFGETDNCPLKKEEKPNESKHGE